MGGYFSFVIISQDDHALSLLAKLGKLSWLLIKQAPRFLLIPFAAVLDGNKGCGVGV